ncbi:hypothetical protein PF005_g7976 [Phytophthora fragariae]|uniref:Uncharacterized protein n=1 Tax=Phytophthora fragariae TaxID=53985 RepID=A0A6A3YKK0_9STRA|nr:hypothetical protein PF003_g37252 [Phytophthora fragariae]KAE9219149.1 hypothetical protein PF005_g7976 [Phytophthora fragariae]
MLRAARKPPYPSRYWNSVPTLSTSTTPPVKLSGGGLCLAFFFMLRRSEIAATTNTKFKWFALKTAGISALDTFGAPTTDPSAARQYASD